MILWQASSRACKESLNLTDLSKACSPVKSCVLLFEAPRANEGVAARDAHEVGWVPMNEHYVRQRARSKNGRGCLQSAVADDRAHVGDDIIEQSHVLWHAQRRAEAID